MDVAFWWWNGNHKGNATGTGRSIFEVGLEMNDRRLAELRLAALAIELAHHHGHNVAFYTNDHRLFDCLPGHITQKVVRTAPAVPAMLWDYAGVWWTNYILQDNPGAVVLDCDVLMFRNWLDGLEKVPIVMQTKEPIPYFPRMRVLPWMLMSNFPKNSEVYAIARAMSTMPYNYNHGIFRCTDPTVLRLWMNMASTIYMDVLNHKPHAVPNELWWDQCRFMLKEMSFALILHQEGIEPNQIVSYENPYQLQENALREGLTHLVGASKLEAENRAGVEKQLYDLFPLSYRRIEDYVEGQG